MVVLGRASHLMNLNEVMRGLRRAGRAVVLVRIGSTSLSTGFFVAPDLVAVPGYAVTRDEPAETIKVQRGREAWRVLEYEVVADISAPHAIGAPPLGLLLLDRPEPGRELAFSTVAAFEGDPISLVHHPHGNPAAALSNGRLVAADSTWIAYDADTAPGSGGGPVLGRDYGVIGMHFRAGTDRNEGLSRAAIVEAMRRSRFWAQLAAAHQFADVAAAEVAIAEASSGQGPSASPSAFRIRAALSPTIDPAALSEPEREELKKIVANPGADKWVLRVSDRRSILAGAGSLAALRAARRRSDHAAEPVIDQILEGPPYSWTEASEEELGWWIQVTRWFSGIADDLPSPAELQTALEQRRIRSRLDVIAGPEFRGREEELRRLHAWYLAGSGPLVITGVGGIGKSALLGRFAQQVGREALLLWLDFDRADLAPDDAVSILSALSEQVRVQAHWQPEEFGADDWGKEAARLGRAIEERGGTPPLLILDSFEAAQYSERYQELWPVIEALSEAAPSLRLCVTGRAEVPNLSLNGREAQTLPLTGLPEPAARDWLVRQGVEGENVLAPVLRIARGIPLILQLAIRYLKTGGRMEDLPANLPNALVGGYLYQRILDRVHNPAIQPLASRLLILRRFTADMFLPLFEGLVEFPPGEPEEWCADLRREMSLFDASGSLRLRTELRAATLELLERENRDMVEEVERRAAQYYAARPDPTVEESAELVYHRLRLGDVAGADSAWRDGCGAFLTYAGEELRDSAARDWLEQRLGDPSEQSDRQWELEAVERIRSARARGHERAVEGILHERGEPGSEGPLLLHRAYQECRAGRKEEAEALLGRTVEAGGGDLGVRALLAALRAEKGDKETAFAMLEAAPDPDEAGPDPRLARLLRSAALIQLTTDIASERTLLRRLRQAGKEDASSTGLSRFDVVLPELLAVGQPMTLESVSVWPDLLASEADLHARMEEERVVAEEETVAVWRGRLLSRWQREGAAGLSDQLPNLAETDRLAVLGWRRWWVGISSEFIPQAANLLRMKETTPSPGRSAVLATLGLLASRLGPVETLTVGGTRLDYHLMVLWATERFKVTPARWAEVAAIMEEGVCRDFRSQAGAIEASDGFEVDIDKFAGGSSGSAAQRIEQACLLFYLLAPGPLEALIGHMVGDPACPMERIY